MKESLRKKLIAYFQKYPLTKYRKKEIILKPGDDVPYISYIKSGYVRVYSLNESGQETTMQIFKPMLYFTMIFNMCNMKNKYFFEAVTPVEMWKAPVKDTLDYFKSDEELSMELMKAFFDKYLEFVDQYNILLSGNAYSKVASVLSFLSEKNEDNGSNEAVIRFNTPHRVIASMTGLTRETVTLQILKLQKEGYIRKNGKQIIVSDIEELRRIARIK